jgi:putative endopeptidase
MFASLTRHALVFYFQHDKGTPMTRTLSLALAAILVFASAAFAEKKAPSSEIPEKREFPLDSAVNPCNDFHKYVCDKVEESFKLRDDRSIHMFAFSDSRERLLEVRKKFMAELPSKKDLNSRTQQLQDIYMSCVDEKEKAKSEKTYVADATKAVSAIKTPEDMITYSNKKLFEGTHALQIIWNEPNKDNPKILDAGLGSRFMLLPDHKYYEQKELMADFQKLLEQFLKTIEPKLSSSAAKKRAQAMIDFQKDYIKVYPVGNVRRQRWSENRTTTQEDVLKKYPNLKLDEVFAKIPKTAKINDPIPESQIFFNDGLKKYPLQVWKDLYLYQTLSEAMDDGYPKYFQANFNFEKKFFGGPEKRPSRQERCTNEVTEYFGKELDAALVDQVFPHFDEKQINEIASKIRQSIIDGIDANKWLTKDAKKEALRKIKTARLQLVKPHTDKEWDFTPERKYSRTDFQANITKFYEARMAKTLQELTEPANQDAWGMGPLTVNAYYSPPENKFVLPIGILQYPFYDKDGNIIENLGAVGAVIGHELGHGIDDEGSKYDSEGKLHQWMTMQDLKEFSDRGQRLIEFFNKADHDGKLTQGENIADLVGLSFAYNAAFPKGKGSAEDKQKFFVAYGRLWCTVVRPDYAKLMRKTDPHAAGFARINEQVKHQPGFTEAFQCKSGDKMSLPESERVKIW